MVGVQERKSTDTGDAVYFSISMKHANTQKVVFCMSVVFSILKAFLNVLWVLKVTWSKHWFRSINVKILNLGKIHLVSLDSTNKDRKQGKDI